MEQKIIMCNNCGGEEITHIEGKNLGICKHCGATIIMPRPNEEIIGLLNTAYLQRATYDFDAAIKTYEYVLDKDSQEKSAYEGLLLAKYGIEYVKDPRSTKLIPTCHRTHFNSIYEDDAYLSLVALCDEEEKEILKDKFAKIDKLQKAIAKQLEKEEDFDVFISYKATDENGEKTEDSVIARNIYDKLTEKNYKVFLAEKTLEDRLGSDYEPIIFKAIQTSKIFVLVGTKKEYVNSVWVKNEWTRFVDRIKNENNGEISSQSFIPVFKDMSPYDMPKVNNKFVQGVDASKIGYAITVADGITKLLKPKDTKDIIKTFNSFENVIEMKQAQKQSKKEYNQKKYKEFQKDKLNFVIYHILQVLCFAIPVVMLLLNFTRGFVYIHRVNLWIWVALGILWGVTLGFTIYIRKKRLIGQSPAKITISAIAYFVALIMCPIMFVSQLYNYIYLYKNNYYTIYDDFNSYCYYTTYEEWNKDPVINSMFIIKGNQSENVFVVPEKINETEVLLQNISLRKSIYEIILRNTKYDSGMQITGAVPPTAQQAEKDVEIISNLTVVENIKDLTLAYIHVGNLNLNFDSTEEMRVYGSSAYSAHNQVLNLNVNNKIEKLALSGFLGVSSLQVNYEGDIFTLSTQDAEVGIGKISLNNNIKEFVITSYYQAQPIEELEIKGVTQDIKIDGNYNISKINIAETNDVFTIWLDDSSKVGEILVNNNVKNLIIKGAPLSSGNEEVGLVKIGRTVEKLSILNDYSGNLVKTICFEGSEQEWNLVDKTIPEGITVLFNQSI